MDEIADLIRLLAEAPAEEPPMTRPRELLDRISIERVAQEGVVPAGPAVPDARPAQREEASGQPSRWKFQAPQVGPVAGPNQSQPVVGMTANPKTGIPEWNTSASPRPSEPVSAPPAKVMSPETFAARVATPKLLEQIAGMPAGVRQRETVTAVASPTPKSQVTITVPPAFQDTYRDLFTAVDEQLDLPPRPMSSAVREIRANMSDLSLESTEAFVSRSYQDVEGNSSDLDRWSL
jgi:hypothetical protein